MKSSKFVKPPVQLTLVSKSSPKTHVFDSLRFMSMNCLGTPGGTLLETFLTIAASYGQRRTWITIRGKCITSNRVCTAGDRLLLCEGSRTSFYFWVLGMLASRGRSANKQLFYLTLLFQHKGLSRSGMELARQMNLNLSPRTYDELLQEHEYESHHNNRLVTVFVCACSKLFQLISLILMK